MRLSSGGEIEMFRANVHREMTGPVGCRGWQADVDEVHVRPCWSDAVKHRSATMNTYVNKCRRLLRVRTTETLSIEAAVYGRTVRRRTRPDNHRAKCPFAKSASENITKWNIVECTVCLNCAVGHALCPAFASLDPETQRNNQNQRYLYSAAYVAGQQRETAVKYMIDSAHCVKVYRRWRLFAKRRNGHKFQWRSGIRTKKEGRKRKEVRKNRWWLSALPIACLRSPTQTQ